jgi:hypothetical protein
VGPVDVVSRGRSRLAVGVRRRAKHRPRRVVGLLLLLALAWAPGCGRGADHPAALKAFLVDGPGSGTWEVVGLAKRRTTWIAPHPDDGAWLLKREATRDGAGRPCVALRGTVAREFLEAPWELFARNYVARGPARPETLPGGEAALHLTWVPRRAGGETARHVWFDAGTGAVLQIEDVAYQGQKVRGIYRRSTGTGELDPERLRPGRPGGEDICVQTEPESLSLEALLQLAPFPLVAPGWLPAGYERIAARFEELDDVRAPGEEPVRLATLLYSDGLGLISVAVAVRSDMDALHEHMARVRPDAAMPSDGEPGGCATLPPETGPVDLGSERLLRRRTDLCRTVLRLDGLEGVSVTLLSRNELAGDEYVKVMESLGRVTAP